MNPADIAKAGTEHAHQVALFCWAANNKAKYPPLEWMFAIPNGGERAPVVAARMKAEGVKAGVSDVMLPSPGRGYVGLFIEMKKFGGKESQKQKDFGAHVSPQGYLYMVCEGWEYAARLISWYMGRDDGGFD